MMRTVLSLALFVSLAACTAERAPVADATPAPGSDRPLDDVPPATASTRPPQTGDAPAPTPADRTPDDEDDLARFDGYGDIAFGTPAAGMEQAWGGKLTTVGKDDNASCYFMTPTWVKTPAEFNFMIGDGKFARFATESAKFTAPGGGKIGMAASQVETLYPGRVERQPHKYTDGKYLRIKDNDSDRVLVFETDAAGKVTEWRVGVPPQVDYVEGCS